MDLTDLIPHARGERERFGGSGIPAVDRPLEPGAKRRDLERWGLPLRARFGPTPYDALLYRNLGRLYLGQERYHDAARTYHAYVDRAPLADDAPALQVAVANAFAAGGFSDRVLEAKVEFVDRFGFEGDWMAVRGGSAPDEVREYLRDVLGELARHYHAVAQASAAPADFAIAAEWYRRRLNGFPDDPEAAEFAFLLAEALDDGGRTLEAAVAYESMASAYPGDARAPEAGRRELRARERSATRPRSPCG